MDLIVARPQFFLVFISNEQNFLSKNKNHNLLQDNLLFLYYHTETFKWHIFARAGNFWSHLYQTRLHMFFFQLVNGKRYGLDRGNVCQPYFV